MRRRKRLTGRSMRNIQPSMRILCVNFVSYPLRRDVSMLQERACGARLDAPSCVRDETRHLVFHVGMCALKGSGKAFACFEVAREVAGVRNVARRFACEVGEWFCETYCNRGRNIMQNVFWLCKTSCMS